MTGGGTVLLVHGDPATLEADAALLRGPGTWRVLTAPDAPAALSAARLHRPNLILSAWDLAGETGPDLARAVRADPLLEGALFVLLCPPEAGEAVLADPAIDDVLLEPVNPVALVARARTMLGLSRMHDQLRADKAELERLHQALAGRFMQLLGLLVHLIDLRVPGAAARGRENARLAAALADRFDVPEPLRRDLDIAARLHEIGRVALASEAGDDGPEDVMEGDGWRYVVAARELLEQTDGLAPAAELIGTCYENWDGTGHPDRLRQGQIPLRARILRVLIDYQALLASSAAGTPESALAMLQAHAGTRYDPLVMAYLEALLRADASSAEPDDRIRLPLGKLAAGMVLADDLCTSSGMKLLAAGAELTPGVLETIRRRHRSDPIVHGVWVRRPPPAAG